MSKRQNSRTSASAVTTSTSDGKEQVIMTRARVRGKKSATAESTISACSAVPAHVPSKVPILTTTKPEEKVSQNYILKSPENQTCLEGTPSKTNFRQRKKKLKAEEHESSRTSTTSNILDQCATSRSNDATEISDQCVISRGNKATDISDQCVNSRSNDAADIVTEVKANEQQKQKFWWDASSVDIFRKRDNPRNGLDCFFSKASFDSVMGFELSLEQKLINQVTKMQLAAQKQKQPEAKKEVIMQPTAAKTKEAAIQPIKPTAAQTKEAAIQPSKPTAAKTKEENPAQKKGNMFSKINFVKGTTETDVLAAQDEVLLPNIKRPDSPCVRKESEHVDFPSKADQPQNKVDKGSGIGFIPTPSIQSKTNVQTERSDIYESAQVQIEGVNVGDHIVNKSQQLTNEVFSTLGKLSIVGLNQQKSSSPSLSLDKRKFNITMNEESKIAAKDTISVCHDHIERSKNLERMSDTVTLKKTVASEKEAEICSNINTHEEPLKLNENVLSSLGTFKSIPSPEEEITADPLSSGKLRKLVIDTGSLPEVETHSSPLVFESLGPSEQNHKTMGLTTNVCGLSESTGGQQLVPDLTARQPLEDAQVTKMSSKYLFSGQEDLSIRQNAGDNNSVPSSVFEKPIVNGNPSANMVLSVDNDIFKDTCKPEARGTMPVKITEECSNTNQISSENLKMVTAIEGDFINLTGKLIKQEPICKNSVPDIDSNSLAAEPGLMVCESGISKRDSSPKHLSEALEVVEPCVDRSLLSGKPEISLATPSLEKCLSGVSPIVKEEKGIFMSHSAEIDSFRSAQNSDTFSSSVDDFLNLASIPMKYTVVVSIPSSDVDVSGLSIDGQSTSGTSMLPTDTRESNHTVSASSIPPSETQIPHHAISATPISPLNKHLSKHTVSGTPISPSNTHESKPTVSGLSLTTSDTQEYNHTVSQLNLNNTLADVTAKLSPKHGHYVQEDTKLLLNCLTNGSPPNCLTNGSPPNCLTNGSPPSYLAGQLRATGSQVEDSHVKDGLPEKDEVSSETELNEDAGELCLVMRSLSSDEESNGEDDDVHHYEPRLTNSTKIEPGFVQQPLTTQTCAVTDIVPDNNVNSSLQQQTVSLKSDDFGANPNLTELAEDAGELCLVMRSLSSDEESNSEDDDVHHNEPRLTNSTKIKPGFVQQPLTTQTCAVTDIVPDNNVNSSLLQQTISLKSDYLGTNPNLLSKSSPNFDQDFALLQTKADFNSASYAIEDTKSFDQGIINDSNSAAPYNGNISTDEYFHLQSAPAPSWSESDIPIFAIREDPPAPVPETKPVIEDQSQPEAGSRNLTGAGDAGSEKGHKGFKKSDLTRDEHELYLKLYNKYVRAYMHRGPPPIFTGAQQKELDVFEKLHRRVLREQQEFQNYLLENAKRNPQSYSFLKTCARNYATCRAKSYHLISKYLNAYSRNLQSHIPLSENGGSVGLKFLETLLEVGVPPRIKLPDLKGKQNPVHVAADVKKIDTHFPKQSKMSVPGYIHHEPVYRDPNIIKLAGKYDFQVAVSSSVLKCLLNNHAPSYDRTWNIPVIVLDLEEGGKTKRIVYLNKPVFENDLHVKDYNTLFHKYALRSMVSQPRNKAATNIVPNPKQRHAQRAKKLDDPFDMFSTSADTIETFGVGSSLFVKKVCTVSQEQTTPSDKKNCKSSRNVKKGHSTRENYRNWDEVQDDNIHLGSFDISCRRSPRVLGQPGALKRSLDEIDVKSPLEPAREGQPPKKMIKLENDTNFPTLNISVASLVQGTQSDHLESPLSPVASPSPPASPETVDHCNLSSNQAVRLIPLSPQKADSTEFPKKESSILRKTSEASLVPKETLLSPLRQRASILNEAESPSAQQRRSARLQSQKPGNPLSPVFNSAKKDKKPLSIPEATLGSLFTPLDSILGPSFGQTTTRDELGSTAENASDYLPPTEVNSSVVYNLWSLGSVSLLIRTRCHGVLKDANKTRRVYFSPKMEFQSMYGYEQVTLHEVAKDWTACFFRPNTNLLRARINAFTSEILLFEELEVGQLLRTSLIFKPENKSEFLERVFQHLLSLPCGKYILAHEAGQDFCGIRGERTGPRSETPNEPKKKKPAVNPLPWVPIDPTMMLPSQVTLNRIPATFLPKDVEIKKGNSKDAAADGRVSNNSCQGGSNNAAGKPYWKKKKNRKRRTEETLNKLYNYQDF